MPQTPHVEQHFKAGAVVRDTVIGMADGLTVPFALAAGLSGAVSTTQVVVVAGLAEVAAGSIAMGLGGYLAARGDAEHYARERAVEERELQEIPEVEAQEVMDVLRQYGVPPEPARHVTDALRKNPKAWVDFMMRFELGLEEPDPKRATRSAATIGGSYILGGLVPLAPYFFCSTAQGALVWSVAVTLLALLVFGFIKAKFTGTAPVRGALQTMLIGGVAAGAAFAIAKAIG